MIQMYEAQIKLLKVIHKYLHDVDAKLDWRPTSNTKLVEIRSKVKQLAPIVGGDAADEIEQAAKDLEQKLFDLGWV